MILASIKDWLVVKPLDLEGHTARVLIMMDKPSFKYHSFFTNTIFFFIFFSTREKQEKAPTQLPTPSPLQPNSISTPSQFNSSRVELEIVKIQLNSLLHLHSNPTPSPL